VTLFKKQIYFLCDVIMRQMNYIFSGPFWWVMGETFFYNFLKCENNFFEDDSFYYVRKCDI